MVNHLIHHNYQAPQAIKTRALNFKLDGEHLFRKVGDRRVKVPHLHERKAI
jgi:hypothetical protein